MRRESTPLLLSFVVAMERSIIAREVSPAEILHRGASLRWADAQWVNPSCLQFHQTSLLGFSARTKTTRRSMPFGVFTDGFLGRDGSSSWVSVWYPILVQALADTKHQFPNRKPDFLVTEVGLILAGLFSWLLCHVTGVSSGCVHWCELILKLWGAKFLSMI